jgi:hypothetical protein
MHRFSTERGLQGRTEADTLLKSQMAVEFTDAVHRVAQTVLRVA